MFSCPQEEAEAAMCETLALIVREVKATEDDLRKMLVSGGLQEDRVRLLVAQVCVCVYLPSCIYLVVKYRKRAALGSCCPVSITLLI